MAETTCPIFYPTLEEFENFYQYINRVEKTLQDLHVGICKIVPPKGWFHRDYDLKQLSSLMIKEPVQQIVTTTYAGVHTVTLFEKANCKLERFLQFDKCNNCKGNPWNIDEELEKKLFDSMSKISSSEKNGGKVVKTGETVITPPMQSNGSIQIIDSSQTDSNESNSCREKLIFDIESPDSNHSETIPSNEASNEPLEESGNDLYWSHDSNQSRPLTTRRKSSVISRSNMASSNDKSRTHFTRSKRKRSDSTTTSTENCNSQENHEERERLFWRFLGSTTHWSHPIYGADMLGTLFNQHDKESSWHLNKLKSLLSYVDSVPGINTPMLYIGTWRSMFAFHVEDMNLASINYLHTGASKSWYSIAPQDKQRFESMADSFHSSERNECSEFLRHKTKLFSPNKLREFAIKYTTIRQDPGEFVITLPGAYHAGFNHGFNIAEATNFATRRWISMGKIAKVCGCRSDSVYLDVRLIETLYYRHKDEVDKDIHPSIKAAADMKGCLRFSIENDTDMDSDEEFSRPRWTCYCRQKKLSEKIDFSSEELKKEEKIYQCIQCKTYCHIDCLEEMIPSVSEKSLCDICHEIDYPRQEAKQSTISPSLDSGMTSERNEPTSVQLINPSISKKREKSSSMGNQSSWNGNPSEIPLRPLPIQHLVPQVKTQPLYPSSPYHTGNIEYPKANQSSLQVSQRPQSLLSLAYAKGPLSLDLPEHNNPNAMMHNKQPYLSCNSHYYSFISNQPRKTNPSSQIDLSKVKSFTPLYNNYQQSNTPHGPTTSMSYRKTVQSMNPSPSNTSQTPKSLSTAYQPIYPRVLPIFPSDISVTKPLAIDDSMISIKKEKSSQMISDVSSCYETSAALSLISLRSSNCLPLNE